MQRLYPLVAASEGVTDLLHEDATIVITISARMILFIFKF
jgi:hypothetical protein